MAAACPIDWLPAELLEDILSRLPWRQLMEVRSVSRRWRAVVLSCLARFWQIHVCGDIRDLEALLSIVESMPTLQRLCIVDVTLHLRTVKRLCAMCPMLEEVSLVDCVVKDFAVKMLMFLLPKLRLLGMPGLGEFLSLLPEQLHTLTLKVPGDLNPALFRHLRRCPQLRELTLQGTSDWTMYEASLKCALAFCPRLEVLDIRGLSSWTSEWIDSLTFCPQLRELHIWAVRYNGIKVDLLALLDACGRLERLSLTSVKIRLPTLQPSGLRRRPGALTHLMIHIGAGMCCATICRLADLLPGLRYLNVGVRGEYARLAYGLRRSKNLQVLEIRLFGIGMALQAEDPVPSDLPVKALTDANHLAAVFRCCPNLTMLCLPFIRLDTCVALIHELESDVSQRGEVTLLVPPKMAPRLAGLTRSIRVLEDNTEAWWKNNDWWLRGLCSCW